MPEVTAADAMRETFYIAYLDLGGTPWLTEFLVLTSWDEDDPVFGGIDTLGIGRYDQPLTLRGAWWTIRTLPGRRRRRELRADQDRIVAPRGGE